MTEFDVVVVGGGPAGLSAALNLVRARRRTLVIDSNRPRNAATLHAHGFLSRDGMSPLELRRIGRKELAAYADAVIATARVESIRPQGDGRFTVSAQGVRGEPDLRTTARSVLIATGLSERMPVISDLRAYYGTQLHSCLECDGYERAGEPLALIGETDDLAERALLLAQWSHDVIVFTNGVGTVTEAEERGLRSRGIRVERRAVAGIDGERGVMTGVRLADGEVITRAGGFVRPIWSPVLDYAEPLGLRRDDDGLVLVDAHGRTTVRGVYAAGDSTAPGPQQLIVAAGEGAHTAAAMNRDLIGAIE